MKDSLILQGKTYISAKRAAKVINYAQDYIGQLCRAGKLDCTMVGRSWFVTEESLLAHRSGAIDTLQEKVSKAIKSSEPEKTAQIENISSEPAFTYEAVKSPFLPEMTKVAKKTAENTPKISQIASGSTTAAGMAFSRNILDLKSSVATFDSPRLSVTHAVVTGLIVVCLIVTGYAASGTFSSNRTLSHSNGQSSVISAFSGFVGKMMHNIGLLFKNDASSVAENSSTKNSPATTPEATPSFNGIAVVPGSNSESADAATKSQIKNSFSDEVSIHPDQSGTAGVITPVFKKTNGNDFVYVLVPVKEKKQ